MSADMMAELLLYFIAKGIVTLPASSDKALLDMPWGSHVCQFYERKEDLVKMLVPYFKQGLEKNDACVPRCSCFPATRKLLMSKGTILCWSGRIPPCMLRIEA
jgi:hypothetical protein